MTEEIIIDGVDVAGCEHRSDTHKELLADGAIKEFFNYCYISNDGCYGVNCYYKQLKRLEQENKELKKANEISIEKVTITAEAKRLQELEQKNKELKIYIESNKQQVEEAEMLVMDNDRLQQEVENLKDIIYYDVEKYRSALEEILESAKFAQCLPCGSGNLEDCLNCNDETTNNGQFCMEKRIHEIKTKCVEVLNDKERN